ncbi:unnamed protein product [Prorocentrum cordatum]|uniref:Uncharacterized protein n=1 Tax=Prorocentrum cordatum TaxID=2364126 RepID=A0ABN9T3H3_9DINO|nr:unnamed protein product [Polarella glacialis]
MYKESSVMQFSCSRSSPARSLLMWRQTLVVSASTVRWIVSRRRGVGPVEIQQLRGAARACVDQTQCSCGQSGGPPRLVPRRRRSFSARRVDGQKEKNCQDDGGISPPMTH